MQKPQSLGDAKLAAEAIRVSQETLAFQREHAPPNVPERIQERRFVPDTILCQRSIDAAVADLGALGEQERVTYWLSYWLQQIEHHFDEDILEEIGDLIATRFMNGEW